MKKVTARHKSSLTLPAESRGINLLDFIANYFSHIERAKWEERFDTGEITLADGTAPDRNTSCKPGTVVYYYRSIDDEPRVPFTEEILFQDENILVADKPHFLPVIPVGHYVNECLLNRLIAKTGIDALAPLHMLDRETAGLVMFAVDKKSRSRYQLLFENQAIKKTYYAVASLPTDYSREDWHIESRIVAADRWPLRKSVEGEVNAVTDIELINRHGGWGYYRLQPRTGKTHQLRLHLMSIGAYIIGDRFYPDMRDNYHGDYENPLQLLAHRLAFDDPANGESRIFESRRTLAWPPTA